MLCDRLGELGLPVGAETAREILRAVLAIEAPRMEIRVRDALQTSLETVRVAAQSALGVLTSTTPVGRPGAPVTPKPVLDPPPRRASQAATPRPAAARRPPVKRNSSDDDDMGEARPVIRRPRGR
jgi:hypothetical protein